MRNGERSRLSSSGRAGSVRERPPAIDPMVDRPFKRKPSLAKQMSQKVMSPEGLPQKAATVEKQSSVTSPGAVAGALHPLIILSTCSQVEHALILSYS